MTKQVSRVKQPSDLLVANCASVNRRGRLPCIPKTAGCSPRPYFAGNPGLSVRPTRDALSADRGNCAPQRVVGSVLKHRPPARPGDFPKRVIAIA